MHSPGPTPAGNAPGYVGADVDLVALDRDHPGFRDPQYRQRRNQIARVALDYREGDPVPRVAYTSQENATWQAVWAHLDALHRRYACRAYCVLASDVALDRRRIPQLAEINARIEPRHGFRLLPVAGLVAPRLFLQCLARGVFLSTQYVRHASRPLYTPEPDVIHELVGHACTFADPAFARLNRAFGEAALRAAGDAVIESIASLYWHTLEFGAIHEQGQLKVYGAGLLSSFGELERIEHGPRLVPFDVELAAATRYDPTEYQAELFVADSLEQVHRDVTAWLAAA